jgi:hypothetical protein
LDAFAEASRAREAWYGKSLSIGGDHNPVPAPTAHAALIAEALDYLSSDPEKSLVSELGVSCSLVRKLHDALARAERAEREQDDWENTNDELLGLINKCIPDKSPDETPDSCDERLRRIVGIEAERDALRAQLAEAEAELAAPESAQARVKELTLLNDDLLARNQALITAMRDLNQVNEKLERELDGLGLVEWACKLEPCGWRECIVQGDNCPTAFAFRRVLPEKEADPANH